MAGDGMNVAVGVGADIGGVGVRVDVGAGVGDASVVVGVGNVGVGVMVDAGADVQAVSSKAASADSAASKAMVVGGLIRCLGIVLPIGCGSPTWVC